MLASVIGQDDPAGLGLRCYPRIPPADQGVIRGRLAFDLHQRQRGANILGGSRMASEQIPSYARPQMSNPRNCPAACRKIRSLPQVRRCGNDDMCSSPSLLVPAKSLPRAFDWGRRWLPLAVVLALAGCGPGSCGAPSITAPTTFLMMGTAHVAGPQGHVASVPLQAFSSPNGIMWTKVTPPNGPCPSAPANPPAAACARSDLAPALSSSPTQYVAAWWGQENDTSTGFNTGCLRDGSQLLVSAHTPSGATGWSSPVVVRCSAAGNIDAQSRPALAWLPSGPGGAEQWFVALRDASDGSILVDPIPVPGTNPATNSIPVPFVQADSNVAFAALNSTTLVLAFRAPGSTLRVLTSTNLMPFVPAFGAIALESGGSLTTGPFAPYLASSPLGALLAVARAHPGGGPQSDIVLFSSSDGITWTRQGAAENVGGPAGIYIPAANGSNSSFVVAYPNYPAANDTVVRVTSATPSVTVPLIESEGVALAFGPTPTLPTAP
jgi:hypothetical protein